MIGLSGISHHSEGLSNGIIHQLPMTWYQLYYEKWIIFHCLSYALCLPQSFSLSWKCQHTVWHPTALDLPTFYYVFVDISRLSKSQSKKILIFYWLLENESKMFFLDEPTTPVTNMDGKSWICVLPMFYNVFVDISPDFLNLKANWFWYLTSCLKMNQKCFSLMNQKHLSH